MVCSGKDNKKLEKMANHLAIRIKYTRSAVVGDMPLSQPHITVNQLLLLAAMGAFRNALCLYLSLLVLPFTIHKCCMHAQCSCTMLCSACI